MKNLVIAILVAITIVVGYVAATSRLRLPIEGITGTLAVIRRGDLRVPINATGTVRAYRRIELKSEASGEVIDILKRAGDRVKARELLVLLQPDDEERNVKRARLDLDVAKARLEEMRINLRQARTADIAAATANIRQIEASLKLAKYRAERVDENPALYHGEEQLQRVSAYEGQLAKLDSAKAALEKARLAVPRAEQAVKQAEATYATYKQNLGDAEKRLAETRIISPIDGIVADIRTQVGAVIQGGMRTITGGTVLGVILDTEKVVVRAEVDEADIGRILEIAPEWAKPGRDESAVVPPDLAEAAQEMEHLPTITVESFPDVEIQGVVERIYPEPTTISGVATYLVDIIITSENQDILLPGMRADVEFTSDHAANVLLCPNEAIREGPGGALGVYVPQKGASATELLTEFIPCKFGLDNGSYSQVLEGLTDRMAVYIKQPAKLQRDRKKRGKGD